VEKTWCSHLDELESVEEAQLIEFSTLKITELNNQLSFDVYFNLNIELLLKSILHNGANYNFYKLPF
jgi:hypothetical protein